jgi:formate hydrogenlyase subunit 4
VYWILLHILLLLVLPPLFMGIINKTKAWFAGRKGAPVLQPYYDLAKLFRKNTVLSRTTGWVFLLGPVVSIVCIFTAGLLIPLAQFKSPVSFLGDFILFAYLMGLARFFTAAAALDTGSSFEGMGAAREVTFACLAEPAIFLAFLALAKLTGTLSLFSILSGVSLGTGSLWAPLLLVVAGIFIVLLAENCRIPVDDPNTHLELTMIHEVMVLDHSGPMLGFIQYGAALKFFILGTFLVDILLPEGYYSASSELGIFLGGMVLLSILTGIVESVMARLPMRKVPNLLVAACLLCGTGFLLIGR